MQPPVAFQSLSSVVEGGLRTLFTQRSFPLYHLMEYQLGWRDERGVPLEFPPTPCRLYGGLCLLTCQSLGGDVSRAVPPAAAAELVHQFAQVHLDLQEGSQTRHHRPTVWWIWGPAQAINAGDGLHAMARLSLIGLRDSALPSETVLHYLQTLDDASLRLCEGMYQEIANQERMDILASSYFRMARDKEGALLGCAMEMGAYAAGAPLEAATALRRFGEELGVAFHVQEDIQSLWGQPVSGKEFGLDVLNKKKGYPIILALEQGPISVKRELGALFAKRVLTPPDVERVRTILEELDARGKAQAAADDIYQKAASAFQSPGNPLGPGQDLLAVARWLATRS
ncbi:MAG: polyprenyl synthetase family protein [Chloroflexi bacterium]|nr:polyprenyl synthetase family protein [Chloroflexota bacterium]